MNKIILLSIVIIFINGCNSDFFKKEQNITMNYKGGNYIKDVDVQHAFVCAPDLVHIGHGNELEVKWGKYYSEKECGPKSNKYKFEEMNNGVYEVYGDEGDSGYYSVMEKDDDKYSIKIVGTEIYVVYVPAN